MRRRKWVLVLAAICAFVFIGIYHGWALLKTNEKIKEYLQDKIRPILSDSFSIKEFKMGLGRVYLKEVNIDIPGQNIALRIEDLRISYSLKSLIIHGFDPTMTTDEIALIHPRFTIKSPSSNKNTGKNRPDSTTSTGFSFKEQVDKFNFIKRITISKGTLVFEDSTENGIQFAGDIDGWIKMTDDTLAFASLTGKLFSSKTNNIIVDGKLNLADFELIQANLLVDNYKMTEGLPILIPDYLKITSGGMAGGFKIYKKEITPAEYGLTGNLSIENGGLRFINRNIFIDNISISAEVCDWDLKVKKARLVANGSPFEMSGGIDDVLNPRANLLFQTNSFDIKTFTRILTPDSPIQLKGKTALTLLLRESFANPVIQADFSSPELTVAEDYSITGVQGQFSLADSIFRIDRLNGLIYDDSIHCSGIFSLVDTTNRFDFSIVIDGNLRDSLSAFPLVNIKTCPYHLKLNMFGTPDYPKADGNFTLKPADRNDHHFLFEGDLGYQNDSLYVKLISPNSQFSVSGQIAQLFENPEFNLQFRNLQETLFDLLEIPFQKQLCGRNILNAQLQGNPEQFDLYAELMQQDNSKLLLLLGDIAQGDSALQIRGELTISPGLNTSMIADYCISITNDTLRIDNFSTDDFFRAKGKVGLAGEKQLQVRLDFSGAEFSKFQPMLKDLTAPIGIEGQLWGNINLEGNLATPHLSGYVALDNVLLNNIGFYNSELSFNFENNVFSIYDFAILKNNQTIFSGNGFLNNQTEHVSFSLFSQQIDFDRLFQIITGEKNIIQGQGSIDLRIRNTLSNPKIDSDICIGNGALYGFRFDSLGCTLGKGVYHEKPLSSLQKAPDSSIIISNLVVQRNNEFTINANGNVPFSQDRPFDFNINGSGNLLAILPEITDFFEKTASEGNFSLQIGGTLEEPYVKNAHYKFRNGFLQLGAVVKKVENVYGEINYNPRSGFVHIQKIVGFVKKDSLLITNIAQAPKRLRNKLSPFIVEDWELSLGIFVLKSSKKGIKLNIPGLMAKGELGRIQVVGKFPNESFYFAGPWEKPRIRGEARLRDFNFTYPFFETNANPNSVVNRMLERTEWDLRAVPVKDTRYVATIASAPDNVYANLMLNDNAGNLNFSGIIEDESFRVEGKIESNRGVVEYLDFNFRIEQIGADFDRVMIDPLVYGKARATVVDSTGQSFNLWLTLYLIDRETGEKQPIGRWEEDNLYFELSSDNLNVGLTDGQILANLGYSAQNVRVKGSDIIGISADNLLFKPLYRPVARKLERLFRLDYVQLSSRFTRNLLEQNFSQTSDEFSKYAFLKSTKLIVGKYLADQLFFLYTGELNTAAPYKSEQPVLGLRHTFGLEYRILPNLSIEMEYDYNNLLRHEKKDRKIMFRHTFPITGME